MPVLAQSSGNAPYTSADPTIWDSAATNYQEWQEANRYPNGFNDGVYTNAGYFYVENKTDWTATSSSDNSTVIPGTTFFLAHDIWGQPDGDFNMFRVHDDSDWNKAEFTYMGSTVECWVFASPDELDDSVWLPWSGLDNSSLIPEGTGNNSIIDTGFIVRADGNPATDVHWFPGDPEPGDPTWNEALYHGCFASAGFNKSFQDTGIDTDPAHDVYHEVYEWKITGVSGGSLTPLRQCTGITIRMVDPPKFAVVYYTDYYNIHLDTPLTPVPPITEVPVFPNWYVIAVALIAAGGLGYLISRRLLKRA